MKYNLNDSGEAAVHSEKKVRHDLSHPVETDSIVDEHSTVCLSIRFPHRFFKAAAAGTPRYRYYMLLKLVADLAASCSVPISTAGSAGRCGGGVVDRWFTTVNEERDTEGK